MEEMNTFQSHVLNCELYKVFAMKVDELRSKVVGAEDIDTLHSENIRPFKKAESQLRACQNMVHAKDKELTEALAELSKANDLLTILGVPGYADLKDPAGT
ncbi:hypothetical protein Fot_22005 [Forsythia ovata]|uniref:Uncharacterized protein n=1 Tax=Forsythia ovata TaxID=205694 RepID=A0ABD1UWH1_9LAMI